MAELRWNPLIKDWVMIASHRQNRPQMPKDWCPFCPGSGKVPDHFTVYEYDNDFPALSQNPPVPDDVEFVWLRTKVRKQSYSYEYSFDGKNYTEIPGTLDAAVLSDDYVLQSYGGFFTGAFVGMACVDYSGYDQTAEFRSFDYKELD